MFFSTDALYRKGVTWYQSSYFQLDTNTKVAADCSPDYFSSSDAIKRVMETIEDPRIFVYLRSPIQRSYSAFLHLKRDGLVDSDFLETMELLKTNRSRLPEHVQAIYWDSCYGYHLQKILEVVPRSNLLVFKFEEEVKTGFRGTINEIERQYEIKFDEEIRVQHRGLATETHPFISKLRGVINGPSKPKQLLKRLFPIKYLSILRYGFNYVIINSPLSRPVQKDQHDWHKLNNDFFKQDIEELSGLLEMSFDEWLN